MKGRRETPTACLLCSNHLLVCGGSLVLRLPLLVIRMNYISAFKLLEQTEMLQKCSFFYYYYHRCYNPHLMSFHTLPLTFDLMGFSWLCEMTKDQTKAPGLIWSLTIEPLWYELTLDTQVPVFTYLSLFYFSSLLAVLTVLADVKAVVSCQQKGALVSKGVLVTKNQMQISIFGA